MNQTGKDVLINKAISLLNEGHIKKSLKEALSARKKYPDEPFIYNLLGVLYSQIGNYEESIKNYSKAIPVLGKYIVGSSKPYEYLVNSIDSFYNQEQLLELITKNWFTNVEYRNLSNGISAIHSGWKI